MTPYYEDDLVTLYHGDCREVLPRLTISADCCIADPPYGETALAWDRWPDGWVGALAGATSSLWCFSSLRLLMNKGHEFAQWRLAQDLVWRKPRPGATGAGRFARVHEYVTHWYRGDWDSIYHQAIRVPYYGPPVKVPAKRNKTAPGATRPMRSTPDYSEPGSRLMESVIEATAGDNRTLLHPTQKPLTLTETLLRYSCPPNGAVLDPFAGSGTTLFAAKTLDIRAVGIEADERYCEIAAKRLTQDTLFGGAA